MVERRWLATDRGVDGVFIGIPPPIERPPGRARGTVPCKRFLFSFEGRPVLLSAFHQETQHADRQFIAGYEGGFADSSGIDEYAAPRGKIYVSGKIIDSAKHRWNSASAERSTCSVRRANSSASARTRRDRAASRAPASAVLPM